MQVTLEPMRATHAALFRTLYAIYDHELVEVGLEHRLDENGLWQPDYTGFWLADRADTRPFLVRAGGEAAGFALVGVRPFEFMSPDADFRLVEFFVRAPFRRQGVGQQAATQVFDQLRGRWELSELADNARAIAFWRKVLGTYTAGRYTEAFLEGEVLQRFDNR